MIEPLSLEEALNASEQTRLLPQFPREFKDRLTAVGTTKPAHYARVIAEKTGLGYQPERLNSYVLLEVEYIFPVAFTRDLSHTLTLDRTAGGNRTVVKYDVPVRLNLSDQRLVDFTESISRAANIMGFSMNYNFDAKSGAYLFQFEKEVDLLTSHQEVAGQIQLLYRTIGRGLLMDNASNGHHN